MIKVALSTKIPGFKRNEIFQFAKEAGFDGVEYVATIRDLYKSPKKILEQLDMYKIPILSLHQPQLLVILTPPVFFSRMISLVTQYKDLHITNHHLSGFLNMFRLHNSSLEKFLAIAKEKNIAVTFESNPLKPHTFGFHRSITRNPELFGEYCEQHNLSITLDTSHVADNSFNIVEFFKKYHKRIALIHMSDYRKKVQHLPLGEGELPFKELFKEIKRLSWKGQITFEIAKFPNAKTKTEKLSHIKKSLDFVRKNI